MLGADHHGYVRRLMAMAAAFGDEPYVNLEILIGQLVNLVRDGEPVRMSKRAGTVVTLEDLVEIRRRGRRALRPRRAARPTRSSTSTSTCCSKRTNDNPVFYVQYAHARTRAVARNAAAAGVDRREFDAELLDARDRERAARRAAEFPRIVRQAAELREPHRVARYLEELAGAYHRWYDNCRVIPLGDEPVERRAPHPAVAQRRDGPGAAQRARPARRERPGADVTDELGETAQRDPADRAAARLGGRRAARSAERRRAWPWIVAVSCSSLLAIGALFVADAIARAHRRARRSASRSSPALDSPADRVDVEVAGLRAPPADRGALDG